MKVLIADDERATLLVLQRQVSKAGYDVVAVNDGAEALQEVKRETFDAIITDWMMPQINGIELIKQVRTLYDKPPFMIMLTALVSEEARLLALGAGADDYVGKPLNLTEVLSHLEEGIARHRQPAPEKILVVPEHGPRRTPPFVGVVVAASTGGPPALIEVFQGLPKRPDTAYFVVQHGPAWMLETFAARLEQETGHTVNYVIRDTVPQGSQVYLASADRHLVMEPVSFRLHTDAGPKENFLRPAADPLFRSASRALGRHCVAAVLTGLGSDGTYGAAHVEANGGAVLVQDPRDALASPMPRTVVNAGIGTVVPSLPRMASEITRAVTRIGVKAGAA